MRERHKALERLLEVKSHLHKLEEARLNDIQRRRQVMTEEQHAMFAFLGNVEKSDSLILGLACRQIARTAKGVRELDAAEQAQKQALLKRGAQKLTLEKILKETTVTLERDAERKALLDIAERLAADSPTSLP
jgi:hypothetical protein